MTRQTLAVVHVAVFLLSRPAEAAESPLRAYYKDDFTLESPGGDFQLKIRGNVHLDLRAYQADDRGSPHSFDLRRGRIDLQGTIHRWFTFRVQPELVGKPYLRNAWVDAAVRPWLHLRLGQMKVPFSSSWATLDNNLNFVERGTSTPVYPFFDRGLLLWGELWGGAVVYNLGAFTGAGIDVDYGSGDIDDSKDVAARLFLQPLLHARREALRGLFLAGQTTWGQMSVPTSRFETGGLRSANFESAIWRWRTEQLIGTDGRVTDCTTAEIDSRLRWGVELHYLLGPLALSAEYLEVRYQGINVYHDLMEGSSRRARERRLEADGAVRSFSVFISGYVTGDRKQLTNFGWKTAKPRRSLGEGGWGALELLGRYSRTWTDRALFAGQRVEGYETGDGALPAGYVAALPGARNRVTAAVLDGADDVHELTLGVSWTVNPMVRVQLNDVFLWTPFDDRDGDSNNDNLLVSGAKSDQSDPTRKNTKTRWENAVMARLIFKL